MRGLLKVVTQLAKCEPHEGMRAVFSLAVLTGGSRRWRRSACCRSLAGGGDLVGIMLLTILLFYFTAFHLKMHIFPQYSPIVGKHSLSYHIYQIYLGIIKRSCVK